MLLKRIINYILDLDIKYLNYSINKQLRKRCSLRVDRRVKIFGLDNFTCGTNVYIGEGSFIKANGGLTIGNNVIISRNLVLYTTSHNYNGNSLPFDNSFISKEVVIGSNSWIGMNVTIAPGTKIGEGVIIGIGARVFGNIPNLAILGSNGKIIAYRNKEHYLKLVKNNQFSDSNGHKI